MAGDAREVPVSRPRVAVASLVLLGLVNLIAVAADRLKQFSMVGMLGLYAPGSSFELLLLNLFMQVPMLLFSPLVGVLLDRWNKWLVIALTCALRAGIVALIPYFFELSGSSLYVLYSIAFLLSIADLTFAPARAAVLPELVRRDQLLQVNAAFWTIGVVGTLGGVLFGGWVFDFRSWQASFTSGAIAYAGAAAVMLPVVALFSRRSRAPQTDPSPPAGTPGPIAGLRVLARSLRDGVFLIKDDRRIAISLTTQSGIFLVGGVVAVIGIARIQEVAPVGKAFFLSIVATSLVAGLIAGSGLASLYRRAIRIERTISVSAMLTGVALTGLGRTETIVPLSIWAGLLGVSISPAFILTETLIQHHSPRDYLGRVFAAREGLVKAAYLAGAAAATAVNTVVAKPAILVALGLFLALFGVLLERTRWLRTEEP
jgi:MFS family permease